MTASVADTDRRIGNGIQLGEVIEVDNANGMVRVRIGELETDFIPWTSIKAGSNHFWWPLEEGEWVVVGAPSGDIAQAVILGSVPTGKNPGHGAGDTFRMTAADGSYVEMAGGNITIHATGDVIITGANVRIN